LFFIAASFIQQVPGIDCFFTSTSSRQQASFHGTKCRFQALKQSADIYSVDKLHVPLFQAW
jgi:hypothetical protein